jgi:hypothetical protein
MGFSGLSNPGTKKSKKRGANYSGLFYYPDGLFIVALKI